MNILFVANRFPYPPYRGDKLKIFNLAGQLHKRHNLYLITFIENKNELSYMEELKKYFKEIHVVYLPKYKALFNCLLNIFSPRPFQINYFHSNKFRVILNKFLNSNKIDVIHTQHLRMSQYTNYLSGHKRVLDLPDAYSLYWKRRSKLKKNFLRKILEVIEYKKVLKYEKNILKFDLTLVCSEEDRKTLISEHQYNKISILPNGVDLSTFYAEKHDYSITDRIIFTGNMKYYPNIDAAVYFSNEILPEILKKFPNVKFYICGQFPTKKIIELQSENIIVTGFVESIAREYTKSTIAISPVRVGAGTLNKVLEPMAIGVPVITTSVGFEGLNAIHGRDIMLAPNKEKFIESSLQLLTDESYRRYIGENGKNLVTKNFSWESVSGKLEGYFEELCNQEKFSDANSSTMDKVETD